MAIIELQDLRASYFGGQVRMFWNFPKNAPETVHIYGLNRSGGEPEIDQRMRISKDLRDCSSGITFDYSGFSSVDVRRVTFCVFLASRNYPPPEMPMLKTKSGCFVDVVVGRAVVHYDIASKSCGGELVSHRIAVRSSSTFDPGLLGYYYNFYGKDIMIELPGHIASGIRAYPPIYLLRETAPPIVCMTGGDNADVAIERRKISGIRWR